VGKSEVEGWILPEDHFGKILPTARRGPLVTTVAALVYCPDLPVPPAPLRSNLDFFVLRGLSDGVRLVFSRQNAGIAGSVIPVAPSDYRIYLF
jgi:hypothetical protein